MDRRTFLSLAATAFAAPQWPDAFRRKVAAYLASAHTGTTPHNTRSMQFVK